MLNPRPEESNDNVSDLVDIDAAASVCVKCREDPVEFVLGGVELVHAVSLMLYFYLLNISRRKVYLKKFVKAQLSTFVFIENSKEWLCYDPGWALLYKLFLEIYTGFDLRGNLNVNEEDKTLYTCVISPAGYFS